MISLMPCAEASTVSPMGTPSRNIRTAACPLVSTQSSVTPFQHHVETAAMNVATRLRPETGTPAAYKSTDIGVRNNILCEEMFQSSHVSLLGGSDKGLQKATLRA